MQMRWIAYYFGSPRWGQEYFIVFDYKFSQWFNKEKHFADSDSLVFRECNLISQTIFCYKRRFRNSAIREPTWLQRKWHMTQRYLHQYDIVDGKKKQEREALHAMLQINTLIMLRNIMLGKHPEACCVTLDTGFAFTHTLLSLCLFDFCFILFLSSRVSLFSLSLFPSPSPAFCFVFFPFLLLSNLSRIQVPMEICASTAGREK